MIGERANQDWTGEIIDTHLHLWDLDRVNYPWLAPNVPPTALLGDLTEIRRNCLAADFLVEAHPLGIVKAVHVEANPDPADPVSETRWLQNQAAVSGLPQAIVAAAALEDPQVHAVLEAHLEMPNVRGVRQSLNWTPEPGRYGEALPDRLADPAWRTGFALLAPLGLSFDLQVDPVQMTAAAELARSFPSTVIIVDHMGMPVERDEDGMSRWRLGMRSLAEPQNTVVKISGLGMLDRYWTMDRIRPLILETIEIFGVDRIMFGSNFPIESLHRSLQELVAAIKTIVAELTLQEQARFFYRNAARYYRID